MNPAAEWLEDAFDEFEYVNREGLTYRSDQDNWRRVQRAYRNYRFDQVYQPMFRLKSDGC